MKMNKNITIKTAAVALMLVSLGAGAADVAPPPAFTGQSAKSVAPANAAPAARAGDYARLEPSEDDMKKARKAKEDYERSHAAVDTYVSDYGTRIEQHVDQNNHVTEIRVTPGTTAIPYTMKNNSDQRVRANPDDKSTLDTPKFIRFSW